MVLRIRTLFTLAASLAVVAGILGVGSGHASPGHREFPANGVYTCKWIAAHPVDAAAAGVSCSSTPPPVGAQDPIVPIPASLLGRSPLDFTSSPDSIDSTTVCFRLPTSGNVGTGVFAWTSGYPYSNYWDINGYIAYNYTWYVQNIGGTNVHVEGITDSYIHSTSVGFNYYREGAQNHAGSAVYWHGCYAD